MNRSEKVQAWLREGYLKKSRKELERLGRDVLGRWGSVVLGAVSGTPIPAELLAIRIGVETGGNPRATSSNDERGLMQWGPWYDYGARWGAGPEKAYVPEIAVPAGVKMWCYQDKLIVDWCKVKLGVEPTGWDRWSLLWCALSNGRPGLQAFLSKMDPDRLPVLQHAMHEMVSPSGAADLWELAEAGRFGLKVYKNDPDKIVRSVVRRTGSAVAACEAAAGLGGDMSYGTAFIVGGAIASLVLLAVVYGPQVLGG